MCSVASKMGRGLEGSSIVGKKFREAGKNFVLRKLAKVPEVGFRGVRVSDEGWYKNFEAIAKLEMFEVGRGQASGMMKSRLAYSEEVEKLPSEA